MAITIDGTDGISPLKASGQTQTTTGTAASPAIASSSDTDTGFFGTNEVNISTGGSTRAKVDSSGNVVGTTSPSKKLHIDSSADQIRLSDGSGGFELRAGNVFKISDDGTERIKLMAQASWALAVKVLTLNFMLEGVSHILM